VCFSLPAKVVSVGESEFEPIEVDVLGERRRWTRLFVPELGVGDWCVAQNGHAVRRLSEVEAQEALAAFRQVVSTR
jgi:hydrogenase maturation factor